MQGEFALVPTDELFAKIESQLNSYSTNGLLDTNMFFTEIRWIINKLGIPAYSMVDAIVTLENHKAYLPCNFYLLDSAWLCDSKKQPQQSPIIQSNFIMYSEITNETISQNTSCSNEALLRNISNGVTIQSTPCNNNNENVLEKVTIKEYVIPEGRSITWKNPVLLTLRNKKSLNTSNCIKDCKNLFAKSPYEISINQEGSKKVLHSTLEEPIIYLKYYGYPEDAETGLPLIPEEPIIQRAIEYHLLHYFFYMAWLDSTDVNIERKIQDLQIKRDQYLMEAMNYCKFPSFNKAIQMSRNTRRKFAAYELMNSKHF